VAPETASKKASAMLMSIVANMKGTAAAAEKVSHNRLTTRKVKRVDTTGGPERVATATSAAMPPIIAAEEANTFQSSLL